MTSYDLSVLTAIMILMHTEVEIKACVGCMLQADHCWQTAHTQQVASLIARPSAGQQTPSLCASTSVHQAPIHVPRAKILQKPAQWYTSGYSCPMSSLDCMPIDSLSIWSCTG